MGRLMEFRGFHISTPTLATRAEFRLMLSSLPWAGMQEPKLQVEHAHMLCVVFLDSISDTIHCDTTF